MNPTMSNAPANNAGTSNSGTSGGGSGGDGQRVSCRKCGKMHDPTRACWDPCPWCNQVHHRAAICNSQKVAEMRLMMQQQQQQQQQQQFGALFPQMGMQTMPAQMQPQQNNAFGFGQGFGRQQPQMQPSFLPMQSFGLGKQGGMPSAGLNRGGDPSSGWNPRGSRGRGTQSKEAAAKKKEEKKEEKKNAAPAVEPKEKAVMLPRPAGEGVSRDARRCRKQKEKKQAEAQKKESEAEQRGEQGEEMDVDPAETPAGTVAGGVSNDSTSTVVAEIEVRNRRLVESLTAARDALEARAAERDIAEFRYRQVRADYETAETLVAQLELDLAKSARDERVLGRQVGERAPEPDFPRAEDAHLPLPLALRLTAEQTEHEHQIVDVASGTRLPGNDDDEEITDDLEL